MRMPSTSSARSETLLAEPCRRLVHSRECRVVMYLHMHGWLGRAMCDHHSSAHIRYTDTNASLLCMAQGSCMLQRVLCHFLPSLPDPCFGEGAGGRAWSSFEFHAQALWGVLHGAPGVRGVPQVSWPACQYLPRRCWQEVQCPKSK